MGADRLPGGTALILHLTIPALSLTSYRRSTLLCISGDTMKRIMGMLVFQNMDDTERAMDALDAVGYEFNVRHDIVDIYSPAVFVEAWRYVAPDADEWAAISAVFDELNQIVDPFDGIADDVGVFAEGELHKYGNETFFLMH
jgi:hypothetical protein